MPKQQFKDFMYHHIPQLADIFLNKFATEHYYYLDYKSLDFEEITLENFIIRTDEERKNDTNFIAFFKIEATIVEPTIDGNTIRYKPSLKKIIRKEIAKQNPEVFDDISFKGFYPLGLDIHCFQNKAHGPSTDLDNFDDNFENGKRIHVHDTATLTINGTIETDCYEEHQQLFIDAFKQTFKDNQLFRLNLITMSGFKQDAIVFDTFGIDNIITVPLTRSDKKKLVLEKLNDIIEYIK